MDGSIDTILKLVQSAPIVLLIYAGMKEWYVWGTTYKRVLQERDDWKAIALRSLNIAEKVT